MNIIKKYNISKKQRTILESLLPKIKKIIKEETNKNKDDDLDDLDDLENSDDLEEHILNELFEDESTNIAKPENTISLKNTDDENAKLIIEWLAYIILQTKNGKL